VFSHNAAANEQLFAFRDPDVEGYFRALFDADSRMHMADSEDAWTHWRPIAAACGAQLRVSELLVQSPPAVAVAGEVRVPSASSNAAGASATAIATAIATTTTTTAGAAATAMPPTPAQMSTIVLPHASMQLMLSMTARCSRLFSAKSAAGFTLAEVFAAVQLLFAAAATDPQLLLDVDVRGSRFRSLEVVGGRKGCPRVALDWML
jgi:hypothetical protein